MKRNRMEQRGVHKHKAKNSKRREIACFSRTLIILIAVAVLAASLLAGYARFRDVIFPLPTPVYRFSRNADISYQVQNRTSEFFDQTIQGMDMVYLSDYANLLLPVIKYEISGNNDVSIAGHYQMVAIVRLRDRTNPHEIVHEKSLPLSDKIEIDIEDKELKLEESAQIDLNSIYELLESFKQESGLDVSYELEAGLQTDFVITSSERELIRIQERPGLVMPVGNDTFTINRNELQELNETIWQIRRWQLELIPMPIWIYPVVIILSLMLLVFFLVTTRNRKRPRFNKQLNRMIRMARGRLMLIGDKAWEPEWCITASNFKTMVKTARKLKHPIFCFIDKESDIPSAFFYVYYGENNYCYIYTGKPDRKWYKKTRQKDDWSEQIISESAKPLIDLPETKTEVVSKNEQIYNNNEPNK